MPAWRADSDGVRLTVQLQPGAKAARIDGAAQTRDGQAALKVSVPDPPADGRANQALVKLLAKHLKLPKSTVRVVAGRTGRAKTLHLAGDPDDLTARLAAAAPEAAGP